ncbi:MAG TPA: bi-domain-containing oxidoreductase [Acidimicrobiales bacterium]|nr:bi-domain-containing oxidoreductase [Acidimicrobiales bacterium]
MKVEEAKLSMLGKARARPDQVRKVVDSVSQLGPMATYKKVATRLDSYTALGYSLCGVIIQVGRGAEEFRVGQVVACAGSEHAMHAEVNWVPTNLCVPVPDGVDARLAAFTTVGAIALHGVRRAEAQLGETACVVGLGLVGQLVVQLLVAAGVRVVGLDPMPDRGDLAVAAGALVCAPPSEDGVDRVARVLDATTVGLGADHIFLANSGSSSDPVRVAARLARDRARVIDIGKCRLDLPWNEYYEKELDVRFSRSYGPGRYDHRYELEGIDYPVGYVRWTERRNLTCFLDLVARGELVLDRLVSRVFPVEEAVSVYKQLDEDQLHGVGFLFEYQAATTPSCPHELSPAPDHLKASPRAVGSKLRVAFLGAGNYASSMLLPHLTGHDTVELAHVVTTTSLSALNAHRRFGFTTYSTDVSVVLDDESIDLVFVATRHHSHAELTCQALAHGKAVFVEKPLALSIEELDRILEVIHKTGNDRLMVGFNRRFAPLLVDLRSRFGPRSGAALAQYFVNAGPLEHGSWYGDSRTEGSRFEGEGGHFIDTVSWWLDALPVEVYAVSSGDRDGVLASLRFNDGSVAGITYSVEGHRRYPKEIFEVAADGRTARLDNFRQSTLWSGRRRRARLRRGRVDKGQRQQLEHLLQAIRSGAPMPIPLASLVATTGATLAVARSQASGRPEPV